MWEIPIWASISIRILVTAVSILLFGRLLAKDFSTSRVNSAFAALVAIGALWLADFEGAGRVAFLGLEIDRRVEAANAILSRLSDLEAVASETVSSLALVQEAASNTEARLQKANVREQALFEIDKLKNRAVKGDRQAYLVLTKFSDDDPELHERAVAAESEAKRSYIGVTRTKGVKLSRTRPNGERVEGDDFPTAWLIEDLEKNSNWQVRTRAATLLRDRRHIGVPEALLAAMENDANLWVAKEALESFERITGFEQIDVFQFFITDLREWYDENREEVASRLSKPDAE